MDSNKLRSYADRLIDCTSDYEDSSPYQESDHPTELMSRGDTAFILDLSKYEKIRRKLLETEQWGEKFTEEYIDKALKNFLFRIRGEASNRNAVVYFTELVNEIESYSQEQIVYVALSGITLSVETLDIGNIKLFSMADERFNTLAKQIESVMANQEGTAEQKQKVIQLWLGNLKDCVCAEYRCVAEPDRARERTNEECQRIFDLLRFSIHMMGQDHYRIAVGYLGEVSRYIRTIPVISSDTQRFVISSHTVGPLAHFIIDSQTIDKMQKLGIFQVAELLKRKLAEDSFGETLLRGLRWFSNAQIQVVSENQFLNLMTCLETFLTRRGIEQITNTVAEGAAFVLGTGLAERRRLKSRILDFYDYRSRVSHGGQSAILNSDLEEFKDIVGNFLESMIQKMDEFKDRKDLDEWIENQKFGG